MTGDEAGARAILSELEQRDGYVSPYHLAFIYTGLGDADRAVQLLERALEEGAGSADELLHELYCCRGNNNRAAAPSRGSHGAVEEALNFRAGEGLYRRGEATFPVVSTQRDHHRGRGGTATEGSEVFGGQPNTR